MNSNHAAWPKIPAVKSIRSEALPIEESFLDLAARFAHLPGTVVLASGGGRLDCARHHILALRPFLSFSGKKNRLNLKADELETSLDADPIAAFKEILCAVKDGLPALPEPVSAGLFGYLAYDLKDHLEKLPRTTIDDLHLPEICFFAPSLIVVEDIVENTRTLHRVVPENWDEKMIVVPLEWFRKICALPCPSYQPFEGVPETLRSNFSKPEYLAALDTIHEYIAAGDIYQVNMSQRFSMAYSGSGFDLFRRLFAMNPAPFFAYVQAGDHEIVSTSPERFLHQNGRRLETRPIKGTRKRGGSALEDDLMRRELSDSAKEDAELSMIVDLMRNDLGRVCREGSVRVAEHKRVEAYENVFHLISIVNGELAQGCDAADVIAATFPGGSITGCPKVRAMEIIDELEPVCRHLYTGAIGYVSLHDTMDLSIAIRTAVLTKGRIHFGVGGGIVFDSNPEDEFEETLHKGKTLMAACMQTSSGKQEKKNDMGTDIPHVWFNGTLIPADQATIPMMDSGFQYGFGFFETLRAEEGRPLRLSAHLHRFEKSWKHFFNLPLPELSWETIIRQVLGKNNLTRGAAAVKLMTAKADSHRPPFHPHLMVTARPYTHRLTMLGRKGLHLGVYPHPRQTPLADHKTLNYLYYLQAGAWAKANGFDEALILNPDGTFSETNTGNLAMIRAKALIEPASPHALPGVMAASLREAARREGFETRQVPISQEMLASADQVWVTNALMGAVPVLKIGEVFLELREDICKMVNGWLTGD